MRRHTVFPFIASVFIKKTLVITFTLISVFLTHAEAQTIEFESSGSKGKESKSTVIMLLERSVPQDIQSSVDYTVTGTATGGGVDYILTSGTVTFNPGDKTNDDIVAIIVDDLRDEPDETIIVTLSNPQNGTLGEKITYTYTIEDDDKPGEAKGVISMRCYPEATTYGEIIEFCVEITDNPLSMSAIGLDFLFDQSDYSFQGVSAGSLTDDWTVINGAQEEPGKIKIEAQAGSGSYIPELSRGSVLRIGLQAKCLNLSADKESTVTIDNYGYDFDDEFTPESVEASLTVRPCSILGDVNGDGQGTPGDAQLAFAIFLGKTIPDFCQTSTSDTNCNGAISPGDAQYIFDHYLGRISLPECCEEAESSSTGMTHLWHTEAQKPNAKRRLFPLSIIARPEETIAVPIIITHPRGVRCFSFDLVYPGEALTYLGLRKSPMTSFFRSIKGIPLGEGFVRIEGEAAVPIEARHLGSLAVVLFKVHKSIPMQQSLRIINPERDIAGTEMAEGLVTHQYDHGEDTNFISFGETIHLADNTLKIPVFINHMSAIKAFGMEYEFSNEKLEFLGIEPVGFVEDFLAVESNLVGEGRFRVGGFNMSPLQTSSPSIFFEMIFHMKEKGGFVTIIEMVDDIQHYSVLVPSLLIE